jgi:ELWxxDGT repeat protein
MILHDHARGITIRESRRAAAWLSDNSQTDALLTNRQQLARGSPMSLPIWRRKSKASQADKHEAPKKPAWQRLNRWFPRLESLENRLLPSLGPYVVSPLTGTSLTDYTGTLFFAANDGVHGSQLWESNGSPAGTAMVTDINPGTVGFSPSSLTNVSGTLFFVADDGVHGKELWRSNGLAAGTTLVSDIVPGSVGSNPVLLTNLSGTLFFAAGDGGVDRAGLASYKLWRSDGTSAGTSVAADFNPGFAAEVPGAMANVNGTLFFGTNDTLFDSNHGTALWRSNGTAAGTSLVEDFTDTTNNSGGLYPWLLTDVSGTLYFTVNNKGNGDTLFRSDGTAAGTTVLTGVGPAANLGPAGDLTNVNGTLFFEAAIPNSDSLFRSDGTTAGTTLIDIDYPQNTPIPNPDPIFLTNVNGTLFFDAFEKDHGFELWQSNGSTAGTAMVADLNPGSASSISVRVSPYLTNVNGTLFFDAFNGVQSDLWGLRQVASAANTTTAITASDSAPVVGEPVTYTATISAVPPGSGAPDYGTVTFQFDGGSGISVDISNGQATITRPWSVPGSGHTVNATFTGNAGVYNASTAPQLTVTLPKASTTTTITSPDSTPHFGETATYTATISPVFPTTVPPADGTVAFKIDGGAAISANVVNGVATITHTWPTAGSSDTVDAAFNGDDSAGGYNGSTAPQLAFMVSQDSTRTALNQRPLDQPNQVTFLHQAATFIARVTSDHGGTPTGSVTFLDGTATLQAGVAFSSAVKGSATATFSTSSLSPGGHSISAVYSDNSGDNGYVGSTSAKILHWVAFQPRPLIRGAAPAGSTSYVAVGSLTFFSANDGTHGQELWETNGTSPGTVLVKDINPRGAGSYPNYLTNLNGTLFFSAVTGTLGPRLWESDGTYSGTFAVKDIDPVHFTPIVNVKYLTNVSGTLFFSASNGVNGQELWKSNGTTAGTVLVKDIAQGSTNSNPSQLTNVNGTLFFVADDGTHGAELFKSNGVGAGLGTVMVKDINESNTGASITDMTNINGTLFFSANNGVSGQELWKSNGTTPGTLLIKDIHPGSTGSYPSQLTNVNGTLFFVADDGVRGRELFRSNGNGLGSGTIMVKDINPGSAGSSPSNLTNVNGTLFFSATNGVSGMELWRSDGTVTGTGLVRDLNPGSAGSNPTQLTNVNGTLFFSAADGVHGTELWETNGSGLGYGMLKVLYVYSGDAISSPTSLTNVNGVLFFTSNSGAGVEPWELSL